MTIYYVCTEGSDSNNGLASCTAWKTIQKALDTAVGGDSVYVESGLYRERLVVTQNYASKLRLVGGETTIIDGGDIVTASWSPTTEFGGVGLYRAQLPYQPWAMSVDLPNASSVFDYSKQIWRIGTDPMHNYNEFAPGQSFEYLAVQGLFNKDAQEQVYSQYTSTPVYFWDGIEALFGYKDGWTYLRFRHGDDPNEKLLTIAPGPSSTYAMDGSGTITIDGGSNVEFAEFHIRGGRNGVLMTNGAHHNTIEDCVVTGGNCRVRIDSGSHDNTVNCCELKPNHLSGWVAGARHGDENYSSYNRVKNWHLYFIDKFSIGQSSEDDHGVFLWQHGPNNTIKNNDILGGSVGVDTAEGVEDSYTHIESNEIAYCISQGVFIQRGSYRTYVHENKIYDNGINLRMQELESNSHSVWFYRNRMWQPYGQQVWFHATPQTPSPTTSFLYFFHNSLVGPDHVVDLDLGDRISSCENFYVINNVFHGGGMTNTDIYTTSAQFDQNILPPGSSYPGNTTLQTRTWPGDEYPNWDIVPDGAYQTGGNLFAHGLPVPQQAYYDRGITGF